MIPKIYTPAFDVILIPPCCSTLRWGFRFDHAEWRTLLRDSLLFYCYACDKIHPSATAVLNAMSRLNVELSKANENQKKRPQVGFRFGVEISFDSYILLEPLYRQLPVFLRSLESPDLGQALHTHAVQLMREGKPALKINPIKRGGVKLTDLVFDCLECEAFSSFELASRKSPVICHRCGNPQKITREILTDLLDCFEAFQQAVDQANHKQQMVLPTAPGNNPWSESYE